MLQLAALLCCYRVLHQAGCCKSVAVVGSVLLQCIVRCSSFQIQIRKDGANEGSA